MSESQEITLGEVYRRLEDMDERHGGSLDRIVTHLGTLNSKVATHERLHAEGNIRLKNVERELFGAKLDRQAVADQAARDARSGIVVTVPTDGKTIAALLLALAALLAAVAKAWGA